MDNIDKMAHSVKPIKFRTTVIDGIVFLFIFLFAYVVIHNLWDFKVFQSQMGFQIFSAPMSNVLSYVIPLLLFAAIGLLFETRTRRVGLFYTAILMFLFTGYTSLVLLGIFGTVPCSCISVFKGMGWEQQLLFNLAFLIIAILGIILYGKEVRN